MLETDPASWSPWIWFLHGLGACYVLGFVAEYFRLRRLDRLAQNGGAAEVAKYNAGIRGFPHAFYAKMLGHVQRR